jgi:hypothetical protein
MATKIINFKVLIQTKDQEVVLGLKAKRLPETDEELIFYYHGANRFIRVNQVTLKPNPEIRASEIDIN